MQDPYGLIGGWTNVITRPENRAGDHGVDGDIRRTENIPVLCRNIHDVNLAKPRYAKRIIGARNKCALWRQPWRYLEEDLKIIYGVNHGWIKPKLVAAGSHQAHRQRRRKIRSNLMD